MLPANPKYVGVSALPGHVARAIDFQARSDVYVTLGKTTVWSDSSDSTISDQNPPAPTPLKSTPDEPVVVKKATMQLVVPDDNGTIVAYGQKWRAVTPQDAKTLFCRWVLITATFDYAEIPVAAGDSYLSAAGAINDTVLTMQSVAGYLVGDQVQILNQTTTVSAVDPATKQVTLAAPLASAAPKGTYLANLSSVQPFTYRQIGIVSHAGSQGLAGQQVLPYVMLVDPIFEYYCNRTPVMRQLNNRDEATLVLTF